MTLEIKLTVEYCDGTMSEVRLRNKAAAVIEDIMANDLLVRGTNAEVHSWKYKIRRVKKRERIKCPF